MNETEIILSSVLKRNNFSMKKAVTIQNLRRLIIEMRMQKKKVQCPLLGKHPPPPTTNPAIPYIVP
jgi:hypothetical protein